MDQATLDTIKADLLSKKTQLEQELGTIKGEDKSDFPDYGDQSDENAQEVSEYSTNLETERVLENTLKDINAALAKIDKGEYGICKYCQQQIDPKRLLIRPFSSACIDCKNKLQQGA
jgi:DnaK suppressor protein